MTRRLVGHEVPADGSHALKTGYDLLHDAWPHEVMSALGVPMELLPDVVRSGARLGEVGRVGAEATGIREGTPVIAGMTDGCAAQLAALELRAAQREPTDVLAYPLVSAGERFPFIAPRAEGFMLGEPDDESEHYATLLQGVAYVERLCFDHLDRLGAPIDGQLSLTGGATRSRYWCQLRADVLGRAVRLPEHAQAALGMAVLAASEGRSCSEVAAEMVHVREVIEPRLDRYGRFAEPYVRLVDELEQRGWLDPGVAEHARTRAAR